jgi:hypothetical protein
MVKIVCKIINLSLPNLACFAPWRESIPAFEYFRLPENLRELRKLLNIVVHKVPLIPGLLFLRHAVVGVLLSCAIP